MHGPSRNDLTLEQIRSLGDATVDQRNELRRLLTTKHYSRNWRDRFFGDVWDNRGLSNARATGALHWLRNQPDRDGVPIHATAEQAAEILELLRTKITPGGFANRIRKQLGDGTMSYDQADLALKDLRRLPLKEFIPPAEPGARVSASAVPDGKYTIVGSDARVRHYKVTTGVDGARRIKHLNGPRRNRLITRAEPVRVLLEQIAVDPAAAAKLYAEETKHCAAAQCNQPLHNKDQPGYEHGFGPDCWTKIVAARKIRDHKACIPDDED